MMTTTRRLIPSEAFLGRPQRGARWSCAVAVCIAVALGPAVPVGAAQSAGGETVGSTRAPLHLAISNYQYCRQAPCRYPTEAAYRRTASGPVQGTDNPSKFVAASPGQTIIWSYEDTAAGGPASCDFYGTPPYPSDPTLACIGHAVSFEDDTAEGATVGDELPARKGRWTVRWNVPLDAKPGSLIRYFCNVRDAYVPGGLPHWMYGMTGGLVVMDPLRQ